MTETARPPENWVNYLTVLDEQPAMISVDAGWIGALGHGDAETLLILEIAQKHSARGEIVARAELPALQELAEAIREALPEDYAFLVARSYGGGKMALYVYTPHPDDILALVDEALEDSDYDHASHERQDSDWSYYRDVLYPDEVVWQNISNADLLEKLRAHGDDGTTPRRIDHRALFADRMLAGDFAARMGEIGHEIEAFTDHDDPELPVAVEFWREDAPAELNPLTEAVIRITAEYGGRYDGWGTMVVA